MAPKESAAYQAAANLLGVTHPILLGVGNLITPLAASGTLGDSRVALTFVLRLGIQGLVLLVPYFTLLFLFPRLGLQALYTANSAHSLLDQQLRCFVVAYVFIYIATLLSSYLYGVGRPK